MEKYFLDNTMYSKNKEAHTSAEQESSILKSDKHVLKVPIMSPMPGSGSKTYLNGGNSDLSPIQRYYIIKNTNRNENFEMFFLICIQNTKNTLKV